MMVRGTPVLTPEATTEEARTRFDREKTGPFRRVSDDVSSLPDFTLSAFSTSGSCASPKQSGRREARVIDANDPDSVLQDAQPQMAVFTCDGTRVGVVERVGYDVRGRRDSVVVVYGRLTKRRKRVAGGLVDLVDDGAVLLSIDPQQFRQLPDVSCAA